MIKSFQQFNEARTDRYPYVVHYRNKNGMTDSHYAYYVETLIDYCLEQNAQSFEIFKNDRMMHSTTQEEFLIKWYDPSDSNYWSNRAKKEPELYKKCLNPVKQSDKLRNADDRTGIFERSDWEVRGFTSDYPYIMLWLDVSVTKKRGDNSVEELIKYAEENKVKSFAIYKNTIGLDYADAKYVICWKGDNNTFVHQAKKDPSIWKKNLDVIQQSDKLRDTNDKTGVFESNKELLRRHLEVLEAANDLIKNPKDFSKSDMFLILFGQLYGTNLESWMDQGQSVELAILYNFDEYDFKTIISNDETLEDEKASSQLKNGWKVFTFHVDTSNGLENKQVETILYRHKMFQSKKLNDLNNKSGIFDN